ncbi:hypothetical protein DY000_02056475 [Brassica cretica]|uniref:F-box associated domain-containing protein n=1 Tax=Brassica cretica TaxID=69181 RepID=A0ABQ7AFU5_BRACR|nr:hypothetical protein DY000_02056475 [Brassica cretica]
MENLFVDSEEIVYIDIVSDPIFNVYDDDDWVQYKYIEFDVRSVEIKNGVIYGFTPDKSFRVIYKQSVGFTHPKKHTTTCVSEEKEIEERVEDVTCTNPLEIKNRNKSNNKEDYTFIDGGAPNWTFGLGCMVQAYTLHRYGADNTNFKNLFTVIKLSDVRQIYILLFEEYYVWKSRKRISFYVKISSLEDFGVENHD